MANLFIDVGNTAIKYSIGTDRLEHSRDNVIRTSAFNEITEQLHLVSRIYISSVRSSVALDDFRAQCSQLQKSLFIAETKSYERGLHNAYHQPSNMGIDRWLAMLAARNQSNKEGLVVIDIGTAVTIDFIVNQQHLGGWIGPGFNLMKNALFNNTEKVFGNDNENTEIYFGNDTPDCVDFGCKAQIIGMGKHAVELISTKSSEFDVFITGGNQNIFKYEDFFSTAFFSENLVLDGLTLFVD
ncbi:type III pantothenate kinase [Glaciecola sp. MH2013]|uniref:type III pantothenate kinase n=1 Tax=Glaciecola sp. MH2013 TaxID=2785524 RepID=UPI00189EB4B9|nr:type III pantothenate kinase [Glaciecola sp. MH2013]MBF7075095.1 type III pantothenate kinase [Glaciecola sp. MH2013]